MNVSSECVDNFHWLSSLAVLLQPAGTVTTNSGMHSYVMFHLFRENVMPLGHGNSFWLVLVSHGKAMENDFPKRVVTLSVLIAASTAVTSLASVTIQGESKKVAPLRLSTIFSLGLSLFA